MGMILTLYLISANVYNSVDAPKDRGFSYIEIWTLGTNFPIFLALCEYGFILYLKKVTKEPTNQHQMTNIIESKPDLDEQIKRLDFATMIVSFCFLIIFTCVYWIVLPI